MIALLFIMMFILLALGFEIWAAMGVSAVIYILIRGGIPLDQLAASMVSGVDIYSLVAIPFFMLAGELMNVSGITQHLAKFARFVVGQIRGGLAYVVVIVNIIMAGVSGSAVADASAVCSVLLPAMDKEGYDRKFAAAINSAAAVIGPIIPPSIPMVFMGVITHLSVGKLFLGGVIPGLLMGLFLATSIFLLGRKKKLPVSSERRDFKAFLSVLKEVFFALIAPLVIIVGVVFGIVTIVEVAILAVFYVLFVALFIYRSIRCRDVPGLFARAGAFSATIMAIFAAVGIFSWLIANEQLGQRIGEIILSLHLGKTGFLFIMNLFFLFLGCIMDAIPAMLIFFPILLPIATQLGIDSTHFGVVVVLNLMIGLLTPPVGALLFLVSKIADVSFDDLVKEAFPYIVALLVVLGLITYIPSLVTFIPNSIIR
jgi:tripartite ATP-independent transporter DctM subunit